MTAMKNISNKEIIWDFKGLNEDLRTQGINLRTHFMDNEESEALKTTMTIMNIKYQLPPPTNQGKNNADRAVHTLK